MKSENLTAVLVIRLPKEAIDKLREIAINKGLGVSVLARMWIMEKLQESVQKGKRI